MRYEFFVKVDLKRKNETLICSKCETKAKDFNCFKFEVSNNNMKSEYIQNHYLPIFDFEDKIFHDPSWSLYSSSFCGPMRELNEAEKYLELLENCFGKLT